MKTFVSSAGCALALVCVTTFASAQSQPPQGGMMMQRPMMPQGMQGGQSGHGGHSGHGAAMQPQPGTPASTAAFQQANEKMHKDMDIAYTGNADADFVRGMIPHHQGAIDMAKVVLTYGKDPQLKKLAQDIIAAQEKEIAEMQAWLKANAK